MEANRDKSAHIIAAFAYILVGVFSIACLLPFIMMISASFSEESALLESGVGLLPKNLTVAAYRYTFNNPRMLVGSYVVTILITVIGTIAGLFLIAMTGYVLYRRDFMFRNGVSFFIYFTTLFSAGLAPTYLWMTKYLQLSNSYLAVLLPSLMSPWLIFLMKNFMKSIPFEITESGKIDGAGDFRIFLTLILPTLKPALATVGLFLALGYWNEWYNAMLYLRDVDYQPLQYFLYKIVNEAAFLQQSIAGQNVTLVNLPSQTLKMSTAVLATGPIIFLYPFVQKYFITGITVGSVKG